jgi:ribulose 1,5-bisphosphate synthetase/thiazole synthase
MTVKKGEKPTRREFLAGTGVLAAGGLMFGGGAPRAIAQAPATRHPVLDSVDVLVVGGGPAGIGAALGAARAGAKTLLIENHAFFGGTAAWALGMGMNQMRPGGKPRSAVHEHLINRLTAYGDQAVRLGKHEVYCNVEYLKIAVMDALDEAGAKYLVPIRAVDAIVEANRVAGVVVATKRGLMDIRAKVVADCTGDADVAFFAGAETMTDPDMLMPMTLGLALTNIDEAKVKPADVIAAIRAARPKHPMNPSVFVEVQQIARSRSWYINHSGTADLGRIDGTDPVERSKAECFSRRQAFEMVQSLRESDNPALREIEWVSGGPQVSARETRRVKGVYVLTVEDARAGRVFEDAIAWRSGYVDLGGEKGEAKYGQKMMIHDVPFRSLVPEKIEGLLTAGRCISATHVAAGAGKSMGNCMATGHAAGVACALAARKGIPPRELKVRELQDRLRADGVNLGVENREQKNP